MLIEEKVLVFNGMPLRIAFDPQAIREHFADDRVAQATTEELCMVGYQAMCSEVMYAAFHHALQHSFYSLLGFVPTKLRKGRRTPNTIPPIISAALIAAKQTPST